MSRNNQIVSIIAYCNMLITTSKTLQWSY